MPGVPVDILLFEPMMKGSEVRLAFLRSLVDCGIGTSQGTDRGRHPYHFRHCREVLFVKSSAAIASPAHVKWLHDRLGQPRAHRVCHLVVLATQLLPSPNLMYSCSNLIFSESLLRLTFLHASLGPLALFEGESLLCSPLGST